MQRGARAEKRTRVPPYVHTFHFLFPLEVLIWIWKCRTALLHCAACFEMLNCSEERLPETHSSSCICNFLSHSILLNWPWDFCESVKMRMTSTNTRRFYFLFSHKCSRSRVCGLLTQYLPLNFPPLPQSDFIRSHIYFHFLWCHFSLQRLQRLP